MVNHVTCDGIWQGRFLEIQQSSLQGLRAGPALLSPNGLALGLKDVHVLRWTGEALEIVSSFPAAPTPREQDRRSRKKRKQIVQACVAMCYYR